MAGIASGVLCCCLRLFRLIPDWLDASLESLETAVFPFASGRGLKYLMGSASPMGLPIS
jgi:hypothetical protein